MFLSICYKIHPKTQIEEQKQKSFCPGLVNGIISTKVN